jgi:hypothetical protein
MDERCCKEETWATLRGGRGCLLARYPVPYSTHCTARRILACLLATLHSPPSNLAASSAGVCQSARNDTSLHNIDSDARRSPPPRRISQPRPHSFAKRVPNPAARSHPRYTTMAGLYLLALAYIALGVRAQSSTADASACASTIAPKNAAPSVASGWRANVVANGFSGPRGIVFDSEGGLLVVEGEKGISRITFNGERGGCVRSEGDSSLIIQDESVSRVRTYQLHFTTLDEISTWV